MAKVATPQTESQWVEDAKTQSRRELERKVEATRARAKAACRRRACPEQEELLGAAPEEVDAANAPACDPPVEVGLRFTGAEYARFERLMERLRKSGVREKREEVLLAALEVLAAQEATSQDTTFQGVTRGAFSRSPYRIVVLLCPKGGEGKVNASRGARPLSAAVLRAMACDADVECNGKNRASVPPRLRRAVLARDGYRSCIAGCGSTRFLEVHQVVLREQGGPNAVANLLTLRAKCQGEADRISPPPATRCRGRCRPPT